jgi:HSP20 family protein
MPSKRTSFFDRLTTVINAPASNTIEEHDAEVEADESSSMRVEVPVKPSHRETRVMVGGDDGEGDVGKLLIDLYEADGNLVIQAMIAGVTPENLQISITRERVSIKGKREMPKERPEEYHVSELYWGAFERIIDLPYEVDADNAEAVEKYGLLIVRLPKLDTNKTQELRVKSV